MDLIMDLPLTEGSDSILVVVDQGLLKGVILCPTTKMVTIDGIGDLLHENLYKQFGLPDKMLSDQGPQFAVKAMLSRLKVNLVLSTAYHPQTDGTMERVCQGFIQLFSGFDPKRFCYDLPADTPRSRPDLFLFV
jgi:transposase InsO family protein